MLLELQTRLMSMCDRHPETNHWSLTGARTLWIKEVNSVVATKRAIYAAFIGKIGPSQDVESICELNGCFSPEHLVLRPGNANGRPLDLGQPRHIPVPPMALAASAKSATAPLPSGSTLSVPPSMAALLGDNLGKISVEEAQWLTQMTRW